MKCIYFHEIYNSYINKKCIESKLLGAKLHITHKIKMSIKGGLENP